MMFRLRWIPADMIWPVALLNIIQMIMNFILNLTRNDWEHERADQYVQSYMRIDPSPRSIGNLVGKNTNTPPHPLA